MPESPRQPQVQVTNQVAIFLSRLCLTVQSICYYCRILELTMMLVVIESRINLRC